MMKNVIFIISIFVLLMGCKSDKTEEVEELTISNKESSVVEAGIPSLDDDYLVSIYEAQELIKIEQDNIELRMQYCEKAYMKERGYFISMGIGRKVNPKTGEAIPPSMIERGAKIDAMRWAAYGLNWLKNDYQPSFGKIEAQINQNITVVNRANVGDSLFVFVATKVEEN